ncbi:hypothetical protein ACFLSG_01260 [Candidatus Bipolaricaulota bacterium]
MTEEATDAEAHDSFSVRRFNSAWDLLEKTDRTPAEDEDMLRLSMASSWHRTERLIAQIRTCRSHTGKSLEFTLC